VIGRACAILDPVAVGPIAVDALLLRAQLPELTLRPGLSVVARVASRGEGALGVLVLAGVPLTAQLPEEVRAGETLRLTVSEVSPQQVTMRLDPSPVAVPPAPPPAPEPPPARVTVQEPPRRADAGGEAVHAVSLAFASAVLGRLDLRLEVSSGGVQAVVAAPAGQAHELAAEAAERLRDGLAARTGLPATVRVQPRRDPLDLYA